jgi:hypothetical protein
MHLFDDEDDDEDNEAKMFCGACDLHRLSITYYAVLTQ